MDDTVALGRPDPTSANPPSGATRRPAAAAVTPPAEQPGAVAADASYFDELYEAELEPMVRLAFVLLRDREQAQEIVQDAFAAVYERSGRIANPGGYLRQSVVNGCRRAMRRRQVAERLRRERSQTAELGADHILDAVDRLPVRRRAAVILRYYLDWSEADIAEALGVRPGTVKSMLHRSLEQLRKDLA
jgi:RNA polymerase sigma factor (sigma-70 family)